MTLAPEMTTHPARRPPAPRKRKRTALSERPVLVLDVSGVLVSRVGVWPDARQVALDGIGRVNVSTMLTQAVAKLDAELWWLTRSPGTIPALSTATGVLFPPARVIPVAGSKITALRAALDADPRTHIWADPLAQRVIPALPHLVVRTDSRAGLTPSALRRIRAFLAEGYVA